MKIDISTQLIESFGYVADGIAGKAANALVGAAGASDVYSRAQDDDTAGAVASGVSTAATLAGGPLAAAATGAELFKWAYDNVKERRLAKERGEQAPDATVAQDDYLGRFSKWATTPLWGDNAEKDTQPSWPTTPAEIKAFQSAHGLTVDGIIGKNTAAALQTAGIKPPAQAPEAPAPEAQAPEAPAPEAPAPEAPALGTDMTYADLDAELGAELDKLNESVIDQFTKLRKKLHQIDIN